MDQNHCLNIFNILKHEPQENVSPQKQSVTSSPNKRASYYHNQGQFQFFTQQERASYFTSVEGINGSKKTAAAAGKKPFQTSSIENSHHDSGNGPLSKEAPRTLKDIFRISNTNRKKNKLRKKTNKMVEASRGVPGFAGSETAAPPANISQLIQMQYKIDASRGLGNASGLNRLRMMSDSEFINHLGWLDPNRDRKIMSKKID